MSLSSEDRQQKLRQLYQQDPDGLQDLVENSPFVKWLCKVGDLACLQMLVTLRRKVGAEEEVPAKPRTVLPLFSTFKGFTIPELLLLWNHEVEATHFIASLTLLEEQAYFLSHSRSGKGAKAGSERTSMCRTLDWPVAVSRKSPLSVLEDILSVYNGGNDTITYARNLLTISLQHRKYAFARFYVDTDAGKLALRDLVEHLSWSSLSPLFECVRQIHSSQGEDSDRAASFFSECANVLFSLFKVNILQLPVVGSGKEINAVLSSRNPIVPLFIDVFADFPRATLTKCLPFDKNSFHVTLPDLFRSRLASETLDPPLSEFLDRVSCRKLWGTLLTFLKHVPSQDTQTLALGISCYFSKEGGTTEFLLPEILIRLMRTPCEEGSEEREFLCWLVHILSSDVEREMPTKAYLYGKMHVASAIIRTISALECKFVSEDIPLPHPSDVVTSSHLTNRIPTSRFLISLLVHSFEKEGSNREPKDTPLIKRERRSLEEQLGVQQALAPLFSSDLKCHRSSHVLNTLWAITGQEHVPETKDEENVESVSGETSSGQFESEM